MRNLNAFLLTVVLLTLQACSGYASNATARIGTNSADIYSAGTQLDDDTIETKAMTRIREKYKDTAQITVTSHNRAVLVTGEALDEDAKKNVTRIIYSVPNVKKITNEVVIGTLANTTSRNTDASITNDIKYALNKNKSIQAGVIRVVTDKAVVYLLGLVTHAEASAASEIASTSPGVQKVVRSFEYID